MKNKLVLSILFFLIILITGFIYLNKVFASSHFYVNTIEDFKVLAEKTDIDVVFYGSSHVYAAFNPLIINQKCDIISYNLGASALLMSITDLILSESLKYTKPKLVVLEVYSLAFAKPKTKRKKEHQIRALDFVSNFSFEKIDRVSNLYDKNEFLGVFSPLIRNHAHWNKRSFFNLSKRKGTVINRDFYYNGHISYAASVKETERYEGFQNIRIKRDSTVIKLNQYSIELLDNFIDIAKQNKIEVLLVYAPDLDARWWNYYYFDELEQFAKKRKVGFLNLNDYYSEMELEVLDFLDGAHLNIRGSIKASNFLGDYLNENYSFSDRSQTESYQESMVVFEEFKFLYFPVEPAFFHEQVDQNLTSGFKIEDIRIEKRKNEKLSLKINFSGQTTGSSELKNYRLGIHIYPSKEDLSNLSERSKSRKILFDISHYDFESDENSIEIEIDSKLANINTLELFLYDKEGYKGVIGKKVIISSIVLNPIE